MRNLLLAVLYTALTLGANPAPATDLGPLQTGEMKKLILTEPPAALPEAILTDAKDGEVPLSNWKGKWLVLNFWATWCAPCIKEMPEFERLHRLQGSRGVQVVGLAVDGPTPVREFLAKRPVSYAIGLAGFEGTDLSRKLGNAAGALPFTAVFDREGRLRHRKLGLTAFDELSAWVKDL